jgi:hypothetical protein
MALELVWSNPCPSMRTVAEVRQIIEDEHGSLYVVSYPDGHEEFELTPGRKRAKQNTVEQPEIA